MDKLERLPMCDISTFKGDFLSEKKKSKLKRYSERNDYRNKVHQHKPVEYFKDEQEKENPVLEDKGKSSKLPKKRFLGEDHTSDEDYMPDNDFKSKLRRSSRDVITEVRNSEDTEETKSDDTQDTNSEKNSSSEDEDSDYEDKPYKLQKKKDLSSLLSSDKEYIYNRKYQQENISEYEKMVQKNREEKLAFIESLKINEIKESLSETVRNLQAKPKRKSPITVKRPQPRSSMPVRKSLRLSKENVDLSEEACVARAMSEIEKIEQKKIPAILSFNKALQGADLYEDFVKDFSGLDHENLKPFNDYVSHFHDMQLPETQIAKVVYNRITSMAFHPMREKIIVAAGSKYGKIGFWNVNSDSNPYVFEPHTEGITLLKFNPERPQWIVSSSYDGTLRCGDLESCVFNEAYNVSEETSCTHFDFLSYNTFLVGQKNGNVSVVDYRTRAKAAGKKHQCHDYPVKSVSVHPLDKSYFISADNRGTIKLWDLRKLQAQPIVEVQHHKRCVQSAFFSPLTGKSILTTSSDDTICLFDSSNLGKSILLKNSMKHNNQTGRWLTTFRATWLPNTDDMFVVGSMQYPRRIEIYNDNMKSIFNFTHENLGCITSVNSFHPSLPVLAGANSSGKVYVFGDKGFQ